MLTIREVADLLNVSRGCVYTLVASGQLPCHRIGTGRGTIRVHRNDLASYLSGCKDEGALPPARKSQPKGSGRRFMHLDADRLRVAWQQQGVRVDQPDARSARSSE